MRVGLSLTCAVCLALTFARASAQPPSEPTKDATPSKSDEGELVPAVEPSLVSRLRALERLPALDESVRRPLEVARTALVRSQAASARGDSALRERGHEMARAAVELAEARLRALRERALGRATAQRRVLAERELKSAEQALAHERARVLELRTASARP